MHLGTEVEHHNLVVEFCICLFICFLRLIQYLLYIINFSGWELVRRVSFHFEAVHLAIYIVQSLYIMCCLSLLRPSLPITLLWSDKSSQIWSKQTLTYLLEDVTFLVASSYSLEDFRAWSSNPRNQAKNTDIWKYTRVCCLS